MKERLLELAQKIQPHFKQFYLAGGTAIMFKYNHRESEDLDFLSKRTFSFNRLIKKVSGLFRLEFYEILGDNVDFRIEGIKVSFVLFPFKNIKKIEHFKGIRIASDYDLFLNKIYAAGRRIDWKDPYDAAFLLTIHSWDIKKVKLDFEKKFPTQSFEIYLGALLNFEDYPGLPDWVKDTLQNWSSQIE